MNSLPFTWTNFYMFLIEFAFSILFLILFSSIHYGIVQTTKLGQKIKMSGRFKFIYFFIFGMFISAAIFIVTQVSMISIGYMGMPLTILGLIYAMTLFYDRSIQIGALIPTILWTSYQYNGFIEVNRTWIIQLCAMLIMAAVAIITTFIKDNRSRKLIISCLITYLLLLSLIFATRTKDVVFYALSALVSILVTALYYFVIQRINKTLLHTSKLAHEGVYVDNYYLIPSVLEEHFAQFVISKNISQALVVSFYIEENEERKKFVLEQIYKEFVGDDCLFVKSPYGEYGVILSGNKYSIQNLKESCEGNNLTYRSKNDKLFQLEQKIKNVVSFGWNIRSYVSIYGIHSCNLDSLFKRNNFLFKHDFLNKDKNIVQLYSTDATNTDYYDDVEWTCLQNSFNPKDISIDLELVQMNKSKEVYVCPRFYWMRQLTCDINQIMNKFEITIANSLLRHLAIKTIEMYAHNKQYHSHKLLIYYPIQQLNNNYWSATSLLNKIKLFGLSHSQIILVFDTKNIRAWTKQIINNLQDLERHHIQYLLLGIKKITGLKDVKPLGVALDESVENNFKIIDFIQHNQIRTL